MPDVAERDTAQESGIRLLRTKLFVPLSHPDLVARPRLLDRLDEGAHASLILVSAPAGFGKTTLLSAWIAQRDIPVAWVSLDERDKDPVTFWAYAIAALQTVRPAVGKTALAMLLSPQSPPIEGILIELINDIASLDASIRLVLDDYHAIDEAAIHEGLAFLLEHRPRQFQLIIASREDPPLPLASLRARRQLVELRAADLRFTFAEAEAFFSQALTQPLVQDDLVALESLTEGWAAGLQLAALSMQEVDDIAGLVASFSGSNRYVLDYLAHEVFNRQPVGRRMFLMRTAILDRMTGSLCDAIVDRNDSQAELESLEQANLFVVPLDHQRLWYRYHHLFSDFLRLRLQESLSEDEIAALHRRASAWHASQNEVPEAIHHAFAARDFEGAAAFIAQMVPEMFRRSELRTLVGWFERLPEALVAQNAYLSMTMAWALLALGQSDFVDRHLRDVERIFGVEADGSSETLTLPPEIRGVLGEISCTRATLAFNRQDLAQARQLCQQARDYLAGDATGGVFQSRLSIQGIVAFSQALADEFGGDTEAAVEGFREALILIRQDRNHHLQPMVTSHMAKLQELGGQLRAAQQTYEAALRAAAALGPVSPLSGLAYTGLGALLYEWNDLGQAEAYLEQGVELGKPWSHWEILAAGYVGLARIDLAQGDVKAAQARLDDFVDFARQTAIHWALPAIETYRAWLMVEQGDLASAAAWAETTNVPEDGPLSYAFEQDAAVLARIWLAQGQVEKAERLLVRLVEGAAAGGRWGRVIEALVLQARVLEARNERRGALKALERALELAEPGGYIRTFVDAGQVIRRLLGAIDILPGYVSQLREAFDYGEALGGLSEGTRPSGKLPAATSAVSQLPEPLTDREAEVLALIVEGLTNQAIADQLVVSINTVKTHTRHIYEKLDVRNRAQAARRAIELGLA